MSHKVDSASKEQPSTMGQPATFLSRLLAYLIDSLAATAVLYVVFFILQITGLVSFTALEVISIPAFLFVGVGIYKIFCESLWGATLGRRLFKQHVFYLDKEGKELRADRRFLFAFLRNFWWLLAYPIALFIDPTWIMNIFMLAIAVSIAWRKDYRSFFDLLAGAHVNKLSQTAPLIDAPATPPLDDADSAPKPLNAAELIKMRRAEEAEAKAKAEAGTAEADTVPKAVAEPVSEPVSSEPEVAAEEPTNSFSAAELIKKHRAESAGSSQPRVRRRRALDQDEE